MVLKVIGMCLTFIGAFGLGYVTGAFVHRHIARWRAKRRQRFLLMFASAEYGKAKHERDVEALQKSMDAARKKTHRPVRRWVV